MKKNELLNELASLSLLEVVELYLQAKAGKELSLNSELFYINNRRLIKEHNNGENLDIEPVEDYLDPIKELQTDIDSIAYWYNQPDVLDDENSPFN